MIREQNKATKREQMQQILFQTQKEKNGQEKLVNHKKWQGFNINTFDLIIKKKNIKEIYENTVCKQYHVRVHEGSSPFSFLYGDEI